MDGQGRERNIPGPYQALVGSLESGVCAFLYAPESAEKIKVCTMNVKPAFISNLFLSKCH